MKNPYADPALAKAWEQGFKAALSGGDTNKGDFEKFWRAYPRRIAKGAAEKAWNKLKPNLDEVLTAIRWQVKSPRHLGPDEACFIPHPATWLNAQRWLDEQESGRGSGRGTGGPIALGDVGFGGRPDIDF